LDDLISEFQAMEGLYFTVRKMDELL